MDTKHLIPIKVTTGGEKGTQLGDYLQKQYYENVLRSYFSPEKFDYTTIYANGGKLNDTIPTNNK